ncbi:type II secretion system protein [Rhizosaccharibacter radicis]|uniref:Type II secretion system GspH family protein n=1 Tax=Rhizosaccharibacter radicis TaxID=2782605 RepID=A0ABT1VTL0_9PROT|nr:type II secretion system GspH family protein [Acetobacteraceae bacterium KSS12]
MNLSSSSPASPSVLPARREERGFTLLEVLVAFVIAALALGVLYEGAIGALQASRVADRTSEAVSRARSHLATIGHGVPLRPTAQEGDDGSGFSWRLRIRPGGSIAADGGTLTLWLAEVEERWTDGGHERRVMLRTERVGAAAAGR